MIQLDIFQSMRHFDDRSVPLQHFFPMLRVGSLVGSKSDLAQWLVTSPNFAVVHGHFEEHVCEVFLGYILDDKTVNNTNLITIYIYLTSLIIIRTNNDDVHI